MYTNANIENQGLAATTNLPSAPSDSTDYIPKLNQF